MKVGIVGLGLIGGSLARDLTAAGHVVLGADRLATTVRSARRARAIAGDLGRRNERLAECDVAVLAMPVDAALGALSALTPFLGKASIVTDVGSTKRSIVRAAERLGLGARFVGAHPLAGDHTSGWGSSRRGLFAGQRVYLTPGKRSAAAAVTTVRTLWSAVGAKSVVVGAAEHDQLLAATSHLPQVVALALATLLAEAGIRTQSLGRGGRDMTRLAGSNAEVWSAILTDNRKDVAVRIGRLRKALAQIEAKVAKGDAAALRRMLGAANSWARR